MESTNAKRGHRQCYRANADSSFGRLAAKDAALKRRTARLSKDILASGLCAGARHTHPWPKSSLFFRFGTRTRKDAEHVAV